MFIFILRNKERIDISSIGRDRSNMSKTISMKTYLILVINNLYDLLLGCNQIIIYFYAQISLIFTIVKCMI